MESYRIFVEFALRIARDSYQIAAHLAIVSRRSSGYPEIEYHPGVPGERRLEQMTVPASSVFLT